MSTLAQAKLDEVYRRLTEDGAGPKVLVTLVPEL